MEKIKISKIQDLCGKYINKYTNFKWVEEEKSLYVFYGDNKVAEYKDIKNILDDYGNYIKFDEKTELTIKEAIDYIYSKYANVIKVTFTEDKRCKNKNWFDIKTEAKSPSTSYFGVMEITNSYYPEELGITLK